MKASLATQLEDQSEQSDVIPLFDPLAQTSGQLPATSGGALPSPPAGVSINLYAATSRRAGRLNASSIPEKEVQELLKERQSLLDKKFEGTISRKEENRLTYVRWSLDRIEDAKHGQALDALEEYAAQYEQFLGDIDHLRQQLMRQTRRKRK